MDAFVSSTEYQASQALVSLHSLGTRCLYERASRRLDGEIYCAIHSVTDWNPLLDDRQLRAMENGQVLLEHRPGEALDRHTTAWADRVNRSGAAYLTPATLDGRWMVRVSIGAEPTEQADVDALWRVMREEANRA